MISALRTLTLAAATAGLLFLASCALLDALGDQEVGSTDDAGSQIVDAGPDADPTGSRWDQANWDQATWGR